MRANRENYLLELSKTLRIPFPDNRTSNLVFHGHSIPAGYTTNHVVRTFDAYPHQVHKELSERFPCAVMNAIVTGIGGECAVSGAKRMDEVLTHRPALVTIDYARNDMYQTVEASRNAWRSMIETVLAEEIKVLLVTPAIDSGTLYYDPDKRLSSDEELAQMIRDLADEYAIGCADAFSAFQRKLDGGHSASEFLAGVNHPNRAGHRMIAREILRWFPLVL